MKLNPTNLTPIVGSSLPTWECGLKPLIDLREVEDEEVTPHVGVWIETWYRLKVGFARMVTPHVGVWIETWKLHSAKSLVIGHSPRGSVD